MFRFIKKTFYAAVGFIGLNDYSALKCVSMSNQECKVRPTIVKINSSEPFSVTIDKCSRNCNDTDNFYS